MKSRSLSRLDLIRLKARRILRLERLWHELRFLLLVPVLWCGSALFHLPQSLPDSLHGLVEGGVFIAILWAIHHRIRHLPPFTARQVDTRIERDSRLPFQPLLTLADAPASMSASGRDDRAHLIWAHHQRRALKLAQSVRVRGPRFFPKPRDKAIALAIVLVMGGAFYQSGPHTLSRIRAGAFPGMDDDSVALAHYQAWIDSPSYAPASPLFLGADTHPATTPLAQGATLHVLVTDSNGPPVLRGASDPHYRQLRAESWR